MRIPIDDTRVVLAGQCALFYLLAKFTVTLFSVVWKRFLASPLNIKRKYGGKWALVTGSTDGIGKAYAFALAKCNMNIVLVSRTQSKLDLTATEISELCPSGKKIVRIACNNPMEPPPFIFTGNYMNISIFNDLIYFLVKTKTIAVDFVKDEDISYRLKIAREIEG